MNRETEMQEEHKDLIKKIVDEDARQNGLKALVEYAYKAVDLSRRNRLLKSSKGSKVLAFNMDPKPFIDSFGMLDNFSIEFPHTQVLEQDNGIEQQEGAPPPMTLQGEKLINALNDLRLQAKRSYEEHGLHTLFLTLGRVKWKNKSVASSHSGKAVEGYDYDAPLLLVPIRIEENKSPKKTVISSDLEVLDISLNEVLNLLLEKEYNASPLKFDQQDSDNWLNTYQTICQKVSEIFSELKLEFDVTNDIQIERYSFFRQQIYYDLMFNKEMIFENDFIRALCTHSPLDQKNLDVEIENPDVLLNGDSDFNVLDADTSQLRVIQSVINKNHLNIQGPPGTGKSQTIVNLVSNLLARKKSVLVVCEKQVALEVVFDRLKKTGLHKLCLPIFQKRADKNGADKKRFAKSIIEDRDSVIKSVEHTQATKKLSNPLADRTSKINYLRAYAKVLGEVVEPLSRSLQWVHGEFAKYKNSHSHKGVIWNGHSPLDMTIERYSMIMDVLKDMTPIYNVVNEKQFQCWNDIRKPYFTPDFTDKVSWALQDLKSVLLAGKSLAENFGAESIEDINSLVELSKFLSKINKSKSEFDEWGIDIKQVNTRQLAHISRRFKTKYQSALRYFYPKYYHDCKVVKAWCSSNIPSQHMDYIEVIQAIENKLKLESLGNIQIPKVVLLLPELQRWLENYQQSKDRLNNLFDNEWITPLERLPIKNFLQTIEDMISSANKDGLEKWISYQRYARQLKELGQEWFLVATRNNVLENPIALFARALWSAWLDVYYEQKTELQNFAVKDHERIIKQFKELEHLILQKNASRILEMYAPELKKTMKQGGYQERQLVHQSQLKMKHKPIRKLVKEIGGQLLGYKPCWMISPLTLSSYIPYGSLEFDVVIFDEASQMRVEHALGAIARSKQVLIFGDENQLPPADFFDVSSDVNDDDNQFSNDYESILNATKEILPGANCLLSYHYRSKYEDLISFSNHYVYDDRLTTFPNPDKSHKAVQFEFVENGSFDGGNGGSRKNDIEAQRVVEVCIKKVLEEPDKSLGVISFSKSQEVAIRDALQAYLKNNPQYQSKLDETSDSPTPFFIKNLESVQGDERDIIVLSVGYGRDKRTGEIYNRFGPINGPHGYRRLNVAVTRAKEQIICVSSIKSSDIRNAEGSRGAYLLQRYLEYAERGVASLAASLLVQDQKGIELDSPFEEEVERSLQARGYKVHRQVGASGFKIDLAIINPKNDQEYILGIECDGASYHSSYSARMNDRIRQDILDRLGWKLYRIWSQHWISHKEDIIEDIIKTIS